MYNRNADPDLPSLNVETSSGDSLIADGAAMDRAGQSDLYYTVFALEGLIDHMQAKGGVWFATHEDVARYVREQAGMD